MLQRRLAGKLRQPDRESIEEFLDGFPSVSREQVIAFLEEAKTLVLAAAAE